eukprot:g43949.t1
MSCTWITIIVVCTPLIVVFFGNSVSANCTYLKPQPQTFNSQKPTLSAELFLSSGVMVSRHSPEWDDMNIPRFLGAAGAVAMAENVLAHPFWVLKTLEQLDTSNKTLTTATFDNMTRLYKSKGIRSLFRGFWFCTLSFLPSYAIYLVVYHKVKHLLYNEDTKSFISHLPEDTGPFFGGLLADLATVPFYVPCDIVAQQMLLAKYWRFSSFQVANRIWRDNGLKGFWKGSVITAVEMSFSSAVYWLVYERFKHTAYHFWAPVKDSEGALEKDHHGEALLQFHSVALGGGIVAGAISTIAANPLDVVKTRIQCDAKLTGGPVGPVGPAGQNAYSGMLHGMRHVYRSEGLRGFTRGLMPKVVSKLPLFGLSSVAYEYVLSYALTNKEPK